MPGYELIGKEERDAVLRIFDESGGVLFRHGFDGRRNGSFETLDLEREFAQWLGCTHAQAVSSGSAAVKVALDAIGIGPGDEVITQCFTFVATVEAILLCGATPVLTEVDETLCMDPKDLARRITSRTRAVVPVHMLGCPADLGAILEIADGADVPVVEDAAQALGASFDGRRVGTLGAVGTFSFDFGKTLTTGEGGMVVTNDDHVYLRSRGAHDHGHDSNPAVPRGEDTCSGPGFNFRMTEMQAAVGRVQLTKVDRILDAQEQNWKRLVDAACLPPEIELRVVPPRGRQTYDSLVLKCPTSDVALSLSRSLSKTGLGLKILPESVRWHFARNWGHLGLAGDLDGAWPRSHGLLARSVAFQVPVFLDDLVVDTWRKEWANLA